MERHSIAHALDLAECIPEQNDNWQPLRELLRELRFLAKQEENSK